MRLTIVALAATAVLLTPTLVSAKSDKASDKSFVVAQNDSTQKKKKTENPPPAPPKGQSTY